MGEAIDPGVMLEGVVTEKDKETYLEIHFEVPVGVQRLTVAFDYERAHRTVLDLGLLDPERFRGWSGGERRVFTLSAEEATPSYLPGPILAGQWRLLIGVPNIRNGVASRWKAEVVFGRAGARPGASTFSERPLARGRAWRRGDLHMHTAHSDGSCCAQSGARAPAPLYRTVEAAAARGLDFIAIPDHNTTSHFPAMRELQPAFDRLLLIPGREITTFFGHANVLGPTGFIDFRLGSSSLPSAAELMETAEALGGLFAIAHPLLPSGEKCMGCGWTAKRTDEARLRLIEVVNGGATRAMDGNAEGPYCGIPFWHERLDLGRRIVGIGGSDNHDPSLRPDVPSAVGTPTTLVECEELSERAVLDALLAGRAVIDLQGVAGRSLDLTVRSKAGEAAMGGTIGLAAGEVVEFEVAAACVEGAQVEAVGDHEGLEGLGRLELDSYGRGRFSLRAAARPAWVRVNLRDGEGRLLVIGNPIWLSPTS